MKGGGFCLQTKKGNQSDDCYQTMEDSTGQAFVRHTASGLIARVDAFEEGDTRNVRRLFAQAERIKQERRQLAEAQQMLMLGALFTMIAMSEQDNEQACAARGGFWTFNNTCQER